MKERFMALAFVFSVMPLTAESYRGANFGLLGSPLLFYDSTAKRNFAILGFDTGYQFTNLYVNLQGNINLQTDSARTSPEKTECADGSLLFGYMFRINQDIRFRPAIGGGISNRRFALDAYSKPYESYMGWHLSIRGELLYNLVETAHSSIALGVFSQVTPRFFNNTNDEIGFGFGLRLDYHIDILSMWGDLAETLKRFKRNRENEITGG